MAQRNEEVVSRVAKQILTVLPDCHPFDNNQELQNLLKARINLGQKNKTSVEGTDPSQI
jgi:hypothetical protein